ncbi:MAG: hypothetical protein ACKOLA_12485, partial [Spartobacteria bacterium]
NQPMKTKTKKNRVEPRPRIHISREDRARTNAGKTANSKVRSEGQALAEMERNAEVARIQKASDAKQSLTSV